MIINTNCNDKSCLCELGPQGIQGEPGPDGGLSDYADFFALMPPDNSTTVATSTLTVRNPADNAAALTITPVAGGTNSVSAHLIIIKL